MMMMKRVDGEMSPIYISRCTVFEEIEGLIAMRNV
jgi:hypothetical protein